MMLDIRPVTILTRAILDTSSHWCFIGLSSSSGEVLRAERLWILNGVVTKGAPMRGAVNAMPESATCYPCKADAPFEPLPWPLLPGEVEIEEWRGMSCKFDAQVTSDWGHTYWALFTRMNDETAYETELRPGLHPAPRRQINPDGTETPVWVWEADACNSI